MEDCTMGASVYLAAGKANGSIQLDKAEHAWLLTQVRTHGPAFLGISTVCLEQALQQP
jgi:hypothetical protein